LRLDVGQLVDVARAAQFGLEQVRIGDVQA